MLETLSEQIQVFPAISGLDETQATWELTNFLGTRLRCSEKKLFHLSLPCFVQLNGRFLQLYLFKHTFPMIKKYYKKEIT